MLDTLVVVYGMWFGVVWCGLVWCGVLWCGVVWCCVVCVVLCGVCVWCVCVLLCVVCVYVCVVCVWCCVWHVCVCLCGSECDSKMSLTLLLLYIQTLILKWAYFFSFSSRLWYGDFCHHLGAGDWCHSISHHHHHSSFRYCTGLHETQDHKWVTDAWRCVLPFDMSAGFRW